MPQKLKKLIPIVLICTLLGGAAGFIAAQLSPRTYQASGSYVVAPSPQITQTEEIVRSFDSLQSQGIIPTLLELYRSTSVQRAAADEVGIGPAAEEQYEVTAEVLSDSNTIDVSVVGPDAQLAADFASTLGERGASQFEELYRIYQVNTLDQPSVPTKQHNPGPLALASAGAAIGLLIGLAVASLLGRRPVNSGRRLSPKSGSSGVDVIPHSDSEKATADAASARTHA